MPDPDDFDAQNLHTTPRDDALGRGDRVLVRGSRWRVIEVRAYRACALVHLAGIETDTHPVNARLLAPFDRLRRLDGPPRLRLVSARRRRLALAALTRPGELRAAAQARLDILPYQLDPALLLLRGDATRLLLADEVGLGKTIQAGLAIAELRARGRAARVLVLTPAGLRSQWVDELAGRFGIDAQAIDAAALGRRAAAIPRSINPWQTWPTAVVSVDFAKRPEVLAALADAAWDVLVVDEAHASAAAADRHEAVSRLGARARYVLLLTATPHNGDDRSYAALTDLGRVGPGDEMLVVRRTRREAGVAPDRHVHLLPVRLTDAERRMHRALASYARRVMGGGRGRHDRDAVLAMTVLTKRALSGAAPLLRSLDRRIALLESADRGLGVQMALPLDPTPAIELDPLDREPDGVLACAGLDDPDEERAWLMRIRAHALEAAPADSKLRIVRTLLRRTTEPVVVFTEYRDTLVALDAALSAYAPLVMHGGIEARARMAIADRFRRGPHRLLLATDVAAEGLNLHARCRAVLSLELPWTPSRLEQRVGRVDRIGQTRRVHAFNLLARGTAETDVLAKLLGRLDTMRGTLGEMATPLGTISDETILGAALRGRPLHLVSSPRSTRTRIVKAAPGSREEAALALRFRALWRRICGARDVDVDSVLRDLSTSAPWMGVTRHGGAASGGLVALFRVRVAHAAGHAFDDILLPLSVPVPFVPGAGVRARVRKLLPALRARADREARRLAQAGGEPPPWLRRLAGREHAIAAASTPRSERVQQDLFRRRGLLDSRGAIRHASAPSTPLPDRSSEPPELLLLLVRTR